MQFIVLDLEWNQPMTFQGGGYRAAHGKLLFEMLQIGAVKLDSQLQICDTFNQLIQPSCYFRIHPHIRKITQDPPKTTSRTRRCLRRHTIPLITGAGKTAFC